MTLNGGNGSALGRYGPLAAFVVSVGVIGGYVAAVLTQNPGSIDLKEFALIALGGVLAAPNIAGSIRGNTNVTGGPTSTEAGVPATASHASPGANVVIASLGFVLFVLVAVGLPAIT